MKRIVAIVSILLLVVAYSCKPKQQMPKSQIDQDKSKMEKTLQEETK